MTKPIFSIGHSTHSIENFISLLNIHQIQVVADVRSSPFSRFSPQFNREHFQNSLKSSGIRYVFLGKELGARSNNPACYKRGRVQYERLAQEPSFREGIKRLTQGAIDYRIAIMCAEKDPIECHRALLIGRQLFDTNILVTHIHADGTLETHENMESRLLRICKLPLGDMFKSKKEFVAEAYLIQGDRVAYQDEAMTEAEIERAAAR